MLAVISLLFSIIWTLFQIVFFIIGLVIAIPLIFAISLICCIVSGILLWAVANTICKWLGIDLGDHIVDWVNAADEKCTDWWHEKTGKNKSNENSCNQW